MLLTHWLELLRNRIEDQAARFWTTATAAFRPEHEPLRRPRAARPGSLQPAYAVRPKHSQSRWSKRQRLG